MDAQESMLFLPVSLRHHINQTFNLMGIITELNFDLPFTNEIVRILGQKQLGLKIALKKEISSRM